MNFEYNIIFFLIVCSLGGLLNFVGVYMIMDYLGVESIIEEFGRKKSNFEWFVFSYLGREILGVSV